MKYSELKRESQFTPRKKLSDIFEKHRMSTTPYKHVYVPVAWVECMCNWKSERPTTRHPGIEEPALLDELRRDHEAHVEYMWEQEREKHGRVHKAGNTRSNIF